MPAAEPTQGARGRSAFTRHVAIPVAVAALALAAAVGALTTLTLRAAAFDELGARADAVHRLVDARLHEGRAGRRLARSLVTGTEVAGASVRLVPTRASAAARPGERVYTYPTAAGGPALEIGVPTAAVAAATRRALIAAGAAALFVALLLVAALRTILRRQVARPLSALRDASERLAAGSTDERFPTAGAPPVRALGHALERVAARVAELEALAATDPLTGVANRRFFHSALETELKRAQRASEPLALVLLDLDGFKEINDTHGHPFGDGVLQTVAERLRDTLRATDVLARVGGDEFAILLPGLSGERALAILGRARSEAGESFGGAEVRWCSGIAAYPTDASDAETLLECADAALYCAKSAGEPGDCVYDPDDARAPRNVSEHAAIEALLERPDAIVPVYQPLVSLATGEIAGYEALARFPHPPARRPDEWFALAQSCGLGPALEARAAREALSRRHRPAGTYLSFNLSASALSSPEVLALLPDDLTDIVIEITENERVGEEQLLAAQLQPLRERGARIAIDDAGTGYSGLQQVMRIQPDIIKLDRSLVANVDADPAKAALIDSFVRFARRTGAVVCAEGIETPEELKVLADLDVGYGQGFGLARPGPPWPQVSGWVSGTIRPRTLRTDGTGPSVDSGENGDLRLAHLTARLANVRSAEELPEITELIASEVRADEVGLLRRVADEAALENLTEHAWMPAGKRLALSHYPTIRGVLASQDAVQILLSDASADLGELALLAQSRHASMLLAPIVAHGEVVGLLQCFSANERPWSRTETSRARIVAHQLGPLFEDVLSPDGLATA